MPRAVTGVSFLLDEPIPDFKEACDLVNSVLERNMPTIGVRLDLGVSFIITALSHMTPDDIGVLLPMVTEQINTMAIEIIQDHADRPKAKTSIAHH